MFEKQDRRTKLFQKFKNRFSLKDGFVFLFFFIIAGVFWYVQALDQQRESTLRIPIDYMGIPENVKINNQLPKYLNVVVRDEGMTLVKYNQIKKNPIAIDLERVYFEKGTIIITSDQLKTRVSKYVFPTTAVLQIKPDSILVEYNKLTSKEIPVVLNSAITITPQYILSDSVFIEPSKVEVFGPKNMVDTMKEVKTERVKLEDLSDTTELTVKLERPKDEEIRYSFNDVNVSIFVEQFTEKRFEKNITIINAPENMNVRLFPPAVTVIYNVGLSHFDKVKETDIQVVFDYAEAKEIKKRHYALKVNVNSPYIHNLRISPEFIEFLLEEGK